MAIATFTLPGVRHLCTDSHRQYVLIGATLTEAWIEMDSDDPAKLQAARRLKRAQAGRRWYIGDTLSREITEL